MLNCRACLWRCMQAFDPPAASTHGLRRDVHPILLPAQSRRLQTSTRNGVRRSDPRTAYPTQVERLSKTGQEPWQRSAVAANQKKRERAALRQQLPPLPPRAATDGADTTTMRGRDRGLSVSDWNNRKRELQHLKDPLELATFVRQELGKGRSGEMLQLVRMASQSMQCVVSWNHIIDHFLAKERVNDALKVYNDMKKRAQFPDSYTYTILLRGLSINAHTSGVLGKALSVYHSLSAPNSRVEPSIIHTNAALRVCARSMDMDALWGVAGKIPATGPASANVVTYITIINAIRQSLLADAAMAKSEDEAAARKERGVVEGRRMWEDIVVRWRSADLTIDEELVCAMGRLLLIGSRPRDWDDVLSLVEQTMDIPRLVPRLGTSARQQAGFPQLRAPKVPAHLKFDDDHLGPDKSPMRGDEFLALTAQGVGGAVSNPLSYVQPGNNTVSMVQEACQKIVAFKAASEYWDLLTDPTTYNIHPDLDNLHMRLRTLRLGRASSAAVKLLEDDLLAKGITPKPGTFRIATSTCVRDKNNHNSLNNAGKILQMMLKVLEDADAKVVSMYAELALGSRLVKATDLIDCLTVLNPIVKNMRLQLGVGRERRYSRRVGAVYLTGQDRQDTILALRKVHGVYDKLLLSKMLPEEQKPPFKAERARLTSFIQRLDFKGQSSEAGLPEQTSVDGHTDEADLHGYLQNAQDERNGSAYESKKTVGL